MRSLTIALAAALALGVSLDANAAQAATSTVAKTKAIYTLDDASLGTLLDDPASLAIIKKYAPTIVDHPQLSLARPLTLVQLKRFAGDTLNDDVMAKISTALAAAAPK